MEMDLKILVINAGSSSLKCALFAKEAKPQWTARIGWKENFKGALLSISEKGAEKKEEIKINSNEEAFQELLKKVPQGKISAIGHRVVHGGTDFITTTQITKDVLKKIKTLSFLAPLHNPANVLGIELAQKLFPDSIQFAIFDTAFHHTLAEYAYTYPLPLQMRQKGVRKYGFHGISYSYTSKKAAQMLNRPLAQLKMVICHLGAGCSMCAVKGGKSIDTTMGMTPLEGLMMASRSGSIDPSIPLFLMREEKMAQDAIEHLLNYESGLLGVSEISEDIRDIEKEAAHNKEARLALDMFIHSAQGYLAMMMASLKGVDVLVFTGGIGEHDSFIREKICNAFSFMNIVLDEKKNTASALEDREISSSDSQVKVLVISTQEEWEIALECMKNLSREFQQSS